MNSLNQMKRIPTESDTSLILNNIQNVAKSSTPNDDIKLRFNLFLLITRNGNYCKNLDPDLMSKL